MKVRAITGQTNGGAVICIKDSVIRKHEAGPHGSFLMVLHLPSTDLLL